MPYLSFIYPAALWLLVLLIPLWALAVLTPRRLSPLRFWASLGLRTFLLLALILSLAGTQLLYGVDQVTTVFLIDGSDSISPSARGRAEAFVQEALQQKPAGDRSAIVVFGENALVERAPSDNTLLGRLQSEPAPGRTNIEESVQLGLALLPADTRKRLVLLSDGGENEGRALDAAQLAVGRGVPIDVVDLHTAAGTGNEALLSHLHAPAFVRDGQEIELLATVESSVQQTAILRIYADQEVVVDRQVELSVGSNQFRATVKAEGQGFRRYRAQIEPQQDNRIQNNEVAALVQVQGPPRVLLVEGTAGEASNLLRALEAASITGEVIAPAAIPTDLAGLSAYEAVVLVNVAARDLPVRAIAALPAYVRDLGKGLVMIGGTASYGVGGYGRTPVEEALPVYMDVRDRQDRPDLALVFVIDKSGSMDACHCSGPNRRTAQLNEGGEPKIDIAKEAVIQASSLLGDNDTLGIVTFDNSAHWALPTTRGASPADVAEAVADVQPVGNTNVRSGLRAAEEALAKTDARIKHVVLLTDGWGEGGDNVDIAQRMRDNGITLSVVAAGGGSATYLEGLAINGGGRYYAAEDMAEVPQIFLQETIVAAGNYIVEHPFVPAVANDSPILDSFDAGLPPLYGYNGTTTKDTARTILVADDQSPVLAQWQFGLGRSVAWTSDAKGKWAHDWVTWEQFPRFAAQMIGWVLPNTSSQQMTTDVQVDGGQTTIVATVPDGAGLDQEQLQLTATLLRNTSSSDAEEDTALEVPLVQVAPGEYRATFSSPEPGTYLVQPRGQQEGRDVVQQMAGLVVPYSSEYRQDQGNRELLTSLTHMTGGSELTEPAMAFADTLPTVTRSQEIAFPLLLLALLLLPFDIAVRRLLLHRRDLIDAQSWLQSRLRLQPQPAAAVSDPTLARLSQAKKRAAPMKTGQSGQVQRPAARQAQAAPTPTARQEPSQQPPKAAESTRSGSSHTPPPPAPVDPLERLREAKERARRRARGEE